MLIENKWPGLVTVSASRLKVFKTCQRKHYYQYTLDRQDRPEETRNMAALSGSGLHKAIERYYDAKEVPSLTFQNYMIQTYEQWEKEGVGIKGEEWFSKSLKDGKDMLKKMDFSRWNPTSIEYKFLLPFPNDLQPLVLVSGIIDLIDMDGSIVDHKSTSKLPPQDRLDHDPQFLIYHWAYEQISGYPPYKVYWNHLRTGKIIEVNTAHNYEFKLEQLTRDIQALIQSGPNIEDNQRRLLDDVCIRECSFYSLCFGDKPPVINIEEQ